jgi:SAM-dependent methyltransferase
VTGSPDVPGQPGQPGLPVGSVPPIGHPLRFTVIAHGDRSVLGPMSGERLDALAEGTPLGRGDHVLELGCGKGDLLVRLLARWPEATAEGFDRNPWFLAVARAAAVTAGVERRVSFVETDAPGALVADRSVAMAVAMGATGILGDHAATVAGLARAVRPGGVVLFGDGVWIREPLSSGLASFGMTRDELPEGPEGFAALGVEAGLEVLGVDVVGEAEWDAYEGAYAGAIERWAAANPTDPEAGPFLERAALFRSSYDAWRRDAMGFAVARYRVPGRAAS